MRIHCFLACVLLFSIGCQPSTDQPGKSEQVEAVVTTQSPLLTETEIEVGGGHAATNRAGSNDIAVQLVTGVEDSSNAPRYSPPGKGLDLKPVDVPQSLGFEGLETELVLGWPVEKQSGTKILVTRAAAGEPYSNLFIDTDANGKFDEEPIVARSTESRGNLWSNFKATFKVQYLTDEPVTEDYPVSLWLTVATPTEQPKVLRVSRRGFKQTKATIGDQKVTLVLSDSNNDAIFGEADWWEIQSEDKAVKSSSMRTVGDFVWLGESAYKLKLDDVTGNAGRITSFDPGKTREEDELARDPYSADKKAVKAAKPLEFRHDIDDAIAEAIEKKQRCFIKFETTWCGPCKTMTQYVFTAKDVVDASEGIVCVKVDGDERRDLVERYAVKAYPTGVMIESDGTEASRFIGYQKVVQMADFLKGKP